MQVGLELRKTTGILRGGEHCMTSSILPKFSGVQLVVTRAGSWRRRSDTRGFRLPASSVHKVVSTTLAQNDEGPDRRGRSRILPDLAFRRRFPQAANTQSPFGVLNYEMEATRSSPTTTPVPQDIFHILATFFGFSGEPLALGLTLLVIGVRDSRRMRLGHADDIKLSRTCSHRCIHRGGR
jgi:hypothetical protein